MYFFCVTYIAIVYIPIHDSDGAIIYRIIIYRGGIIFCLGGRFSVGPMGDIIFQGGQYISLSDPQYFSWGTTYLISVLT